jgi:Zn-dependent protease
VKWSWRIGRVAGIGLYVHATFLLLLGWIVLQEYQRGVAAVLGALLYIAAIFAIVVLHELGHALTARRYGIVTRDIILLPIGGVARLERMPREPRQEMIVALAGPAVNVVLALALYAFVRATGGVPAEDPYTIDVAFSGRSILMQLVYVNVWLALFNLLPAFPMDGGRVLRAVLAMRMHNYARATSIAARVGRALALAIGLVGLFGPNRSPFLVLIALFVWLGAASEASAAQTSSTLDGVPIEQLMIRDVRTLAPDEPLSRAVQLTLDGFQQDFPVVDGGGGAGVIGVLTRTDLLRALAEQGPNALVSTAMHRTFAVAGPEEQAEEVLARLRTSDCNAMPVVRGKELLGVLTLDNVGEYIMIKTALRQAKG